MPGIFDFDWFHGPAFEHQKLEARRRCADKKFEHLTPEQRENDGEYRSFVEELEVRCLIYLRDGFSYEMKEMIDMGSTSILSFECEPVDEQYKVGSFVVSMTFEEVVRVEVFAVHPSEKPEDTPLITGFRAGVQQNIPYHGREEPGEPIGE